ncbi:hypothetical protein [Gemmatimonas sp.]|uniref:hypothetical protein n=1 Tax=Gemmatimonas sp. TaxID=1962908 RepID=UPI0025C1205D|nr:hypothetical protein [Gemmatimonas sp.]MCA2991943.1 hypothetical protein [Gemmatimonas sp.]
MASGVPEATATAQVREAQQREQQAAPMERAPDGPFAQSRGVPMQNAMLPARREPSLARDAVMGATRFASGATAGFSDKAMAGLAALDPNISYQDASRQLGSLKDEFASRYPGATTALELGGALTPASPVARLVGAASGAVKAAPAAAGAVNRASRLVGRGVAGGAAGGVAEGIGRQSADKDGDALQTLLSGISGGAVGGALGGAVSAAAPAVKRAGSTIADLTGMRLMAGAPPAGAPLRTPGTGTLMQRAGDALEGLVFPEQASRGADRKIANAITRGGKESLDNVAADTRFQNIMTGGEAMVADQGGSRGMRLARGVKTGNVEAGEALDDAFRGRDERLLGNVRDDIAATVAGPTNTVQAVKSMRNRAKEVSKKLYEKAEPQMVTLSPQSRDVLLDRDPRGIFAAAHRIGRELAQEQGQTIPKLFSRMDDGTRVLTRDALSVQEIDYIKKGIQELADRGTKSGKTISRSRARAMLKNLESLVADADAQVPDYAKARQAFAAPSQRADAMEQALKGGKAFGKAGKSPSYAAGSPDELGDVVGGMSEGQRDFYDIGKGASLYRSAARDARKFTRDLGATTKSDAQDKLRATTQRGDAGKAEELIETARLRAEQTRRGQDIMGGSQTADKGIDDITARIPEKGGQFRYAPLRATMDLLMGQSLAGFQGKTAGEVGKRMALRGQDAEDYLRYLMQFDEFDRLRAASRGNMGRTALTGLLGLSRGQEQ